MHDLVPPLDSIVPRDPPDALAGGGVGLGGRITTKPVSKFGLSFRAEELSLCYQPRKEHGAMSPWLPHQEKDRASGPTLAAWSSSEVAQGENQQLCLWHTLKGGSGGWEDWKKWGCCFCSEPA